MKDDLSANITPPGDPEMAAILASRFIALEPDSTLIVPPADPWPTDWTPIGGACHANAFAWVRRYSGHVVVHGWLHISGTLGRDAVFAAHSVVRDKEENLLEVTKRQGTGHVFVAHEGSSQGFLARSVQGGPWVLVGEVLDAATSAALAKLHAFSAGASLNSICN